MAKSTQTQGNGSANETAETKAARERQEAITQANAKLARMALVTPDVDSVVGAVPELFTNILVPCGKFFSIVEIASAGNVTEDDRIELAYKRASERGQKSEATTLAESMVDCMRVSEFKREQATATNGESVPMKITLAEHCARLAVSAHYAAKNQVLTGEQVKNQVVALLTVSGNPAATAAIGKMLTDQLPSIVALRRVPKQKGESAGTTPATDVTPMLASILGEPATA